MKIRSTLLIPILLSAGLTGPALAADLAAFNGRDCAGKFDASGAREIKFPASFAANKTANECETVGDPSSCVWASGKVKEMIFEPGLGEGVYTARIGPYAWTIDNVVVKDGIVQGFRARNGRMGSADMACVLLPAEQATNQPSKKG